MFKKTLLIFFLSLVILPSFVYAESTPGPQGVVDQIGTSAGYNTQVDKQTGLAKILGTIVATIIAFVGVVFFCYVLYGGFMWLTSAGNEEKITKAKKVIRDGFIGLVIVLGAAGIYALVWTALTTGPEMYNAEQRGAEIGSGWKDKAIGVPEREGWLWGAW